MPVCDSCGETNPELARFCSACGSSLAGVDAPGSRREISVLFCDLVESTSLGGRLDAESLRVILRRYFDAMRAAIDRHGGRVEKFIGDAVMAVFGVPQLHEDDALRAVRAASEMQGSLEELNADLEREWGLRLDVRIGIASGEVVTGRVGLEPTLITGAPVNLAARLEQAAEAGHILLSDRTLRLVSGDVETEPLGFLSLKGFGDDVAAHRLISAPLTTAGPRRRGSALVDRERELGLLVETFRRAVERRRCELLTIIGPPGVGKSRLTDGFREVVGPDVTMLEGRCLSYGEGITFWPMFEVVQQASGFVDSDPVPTAARKIIECLPGLEDAELVAARIGQLLGLFGGPPAPEETFWAIRLFLEAQARRQPLVLVLEDLHWAEPTFLAAIEHVVDRCRTVPIFVLCLARDELLEARPTWGEPREHATVMPLEPMGTDETSELVENLLRGGDLPSEIRARIVSQAEGLPLYAEEIVATLLGEGYLVLRDGAWVLTYDLSQLSLPTTISGLVAARLDRLEAAERAAIERASIVGRDFSSIEVVALSPSEPLGEVEKRLDALVRMELLRRADVDIDGEPTYRFRHMLILDTAYDAMPKTVRAELHERYAKWLEARTQRQAEKYEEVVAYHLERAHRLHSEVGPAGAHLEDLARRAAGRLSSAGRLASGRGDMPASGNLLSRAVRLLPRGGNERSALLHDLAIALWQAGEVEEVESVYREELEAGAALGDPVLEARSRLALAELRMEVDPASISAEELRREAERSIPILEEAGADEDLADALLILGTTHWLNGEISSMLDVSERALALSHLTGSVGRGAANYVGRALVLGTAHCDEALTRLETLEEQVADVRLWEATAALDLATIYAMLDRPDDAAARAERSLSIFEELGQSRWVAEGHHTRGVVHSLAGDAIRAEPEFRAACEWFEQRGEVFELAVHAIDLANGLLDLDRVDGAREIAEMSVSSAAPYDLEAQIGWRTVMAKVLARSGEHAAAATHASDALELVRGTEFLNLRASAFLDTADVAMRAERLSDAGDAAHEALVTYGRKGNRIGARKAEAFLKAL